MVENGLRGSTLPRPENLSATNQANILLRVRLIPGCLNANEYVVFFGEIAGGGGDDALAMDGDLLIGFDR